MEVLTIRKDLLLQYLDDSLIKHLVTTTEETIHKLNFSYLFICNQCSFRTDKISSLKMHNLTHLVNHTPKRTVSFAHMAEDVDIASNTTANVNALEIEANVSDFVTEAITDSHNKHFISNGLEKEFYTKEVEDTYDHDLAENGISTSEPSLNDKKPDLKADKSGLGYNTDRFESDFDSDQLKTDFTAEKAQLDLNAGLRKDNAPDSDFNADESEITNLAHCVNQTPKRTGSFANMTEVDITSNSTVNENTCEIEANVSAFVTEAIMDTHKKHIISNGLEKDFNNKEVEDGYDHDLAEDGISTFEPSVNGIKPDLKADKSRLHYTTDRFESNFDADILETDSTAEKAQVHLNADLRTDNESDSDFSDDESEIDSDSDETDDDSDPDFTIDESDISDDDDEDMKYNMQCEVCSKMMYVKNPSSADGYKCPDCCGDVEVITSIMKKTNISGKHEKATKVHQCNICLQYFSSDASVNVHKLYCSKDSDSPKVSADKASNANPHQCNMCHKSYKRPGDLKRHQKVHKNDAGIAEWNSTAVPISLEELNTCSTPTKADPRSIISKKVLVVTEEDDSYVDTYQCEYCNKSYASKGYLMRHIKSVHSISQSVIVM